MYKPDLALNNLQWLICHKTKPNLTQFVRCLEQGVLCRNNKDMISLKCFLYQDSVFQELNIFY